MGAQLFCLQKDLLYAMGVSREMLPDKGSLTDNAAAQTPCPKRRGAVAREVAGSRVRNKGSALSSSQTHTGAESILISL